MIPARAGASNHEPRNIALKSDARGVAMLRRMRPYSTASKDPMPVPRQTLIEEEVR